MAARLSRHAWPRRSSPEACPQPSSLLLFHSGRVASPSPWAGHPRVSSRPYPVCYLLRVPLWPSYRHLALSVGTCPTRLILSSLKLFRHDFQTIQETCLPPLTQGSLRDTNGQMPCRRELLCSYSLIIFHILLSYLLQHWPKLPESDLYRECGVEDAQKIPRKDHWNTGSCEVKEKCWKISFWYAIYLFDRHLV